MKHADAPEKFMASELDLDEEVRRLQAIAGYPELYPELVRLGAVPSILTLLSHDNGDIAASALELLRELTDADAIEDSVSFAHSTLHISPLHGSSALISLQALVFTLARYFVFSFMRLKAVRLQEVIDDDNLWLGQEEDAKELVDAMVENSALESLVQRLSSFNEAVDEEAVAVTNTLSIFENMVELSPAVRSHLSACQENSKCKHSAALKALRGRRSPSSFYTDPWQS